MNQAIRIRETWEDRLLLTFIYIALGIITIAVAYPIIYIISSSFSSSFAVLGGKVWLLPVEPTLYGYAAVFQYQQIWKGYLNSILYTGAGSTLSVMLTIMMAYPISRKTFVGRNILVWLLLFAMLFSGGLIPYYLVIRNLHLLNTVWAMILPGALSIFSVIVAKSFFQSSIPNDLYEAAQIDGCSDTGFLIRVVLFLSKPVIAVLFLWSAVGNWNSYFNALIFLNDASLYPLQLVLREILVNNNVNTSSMSLSAEQLKHFEDMKTLLKYSVIVISSIPVLILYPFIQKYFVKGVMVGAIKE
ncbi:putative aldouronate transport system permease protein [Paenibacillus sp. yr247]|uniref:carbohydrate ABC transporter permease n=1 Tax=Paenibacillus sp. yr247 TaxID=1761880 RepID=UPI00088DB5F2|nr:carbohydrate ABC transporter permease [Paenibacillus sp. yr247]SDO35384.1 putative aldouronate transport system permease protein [Paenibacillus sp. yr247]